MEFTGIVNLDTDVAMQLQSYFIEKESELSLKIMKSIGPIQENIPELASPLVKGHVLSLAEAVIYFGKKVRTIILNRDLKSTAKLYTEINEKINQDCWNYLEILENCISELFLQIQVLEYDEWTHERFSTFQSIKMTLLHYLDDLEWSVKRLDRQLWQLRHRVLEMSIFDKLKRSLDFFNSRTNWNLLKNLKKSRKYLSFYGGKFHDEFDKYQILHQNVKNQVAKLSDYEVLNNQHADSKEAFIKIYEYLKMWEINLQSKFIPSKGIELLIKNLMDPKRVSHIFEEYQSALLKKLFALAGSLKFTPNEIIEKGLIITDLEQTLPMLQKEISLLGSTVAKYRNFLLKTDPDPYVRARFGFPEWIVGVEPIATKNMQLIKYEIEDMSLQVEDIIHSLHTAGSGDKKIILRKVSQQFELLLHEMAQPLITESTMKNLIEKAVKLLKEVDELTSLDLEVIDFVGVSLSKIIKADWKYQLLFTNPEFEKIYSIHIGILGGRHEDRLYLNRLDELRRFCKELKDLAKNKSLSNYLQEVEFTINDIKGSLQDFLGYVQSIAQRKNISTQLIRDLSTQLLEVRYFFGQYLHELGSMGEDTQVMVNKLIFVDQYLDAIDSVISSISNRT